MRTSSRPGTRTRASVAEAAARSRPGSLDDERELLTIGFVDLQSREQLGEAMTRLADQRPCATTGSTR